jgi:tRNA pseudouridine32 synthase/23S rRNA pseudouridine746 synthase
LQGFELHLNVEKDSTAIDVIAGGAEARSVEVSRQQIKQAMAKGAVWLTREGKTSRLRRVKRHLFPGDEIHVYYNPDVLDQQPGTPVLVSDESDYSVWDKPAMMLSQGSKFGDHCAIDRCVELEIAKPAFTVHRLDRAASGLIMLAHTRKAAAALSSLFRERKIDKHYRVCVVGNFTESPLVINQPLDGKDARSLVNSCIYDEEKNISVLDVSIETGRKHQIRRHLSSLGFPVVGDRLYGNGDSSQDLQLRAVSLQFVCPLSEKEKCFSLGAG